MKLSIIIVTWNTADITLKCVETIKKYVNGVTYEIIVVDNGSQDYTVAKLSKIKDLVLIENGANLGFSKANNIGVKKAKGDYILFLNSDMEILDNKLRDMLHFLEKNPRIGAIGPGFLNPDLSPQASVFPPQTALNAFKEFWLNIPSYSKYQPDTGTPVSVWSISGGAILIKKSLFEKIGGWNEKYFFYFEDMDLCRTLHHFGKSVYYFPSFKVIHRHGASGKNLAPSATQWKRLIPGSILYHGKFEHYLINLIIWSGQKWQKIRKILSL